MKKPPDDLRGSGAELEGSDPLAAENARLRREVLELREQLAARTAEVESAASDAAAAKAVQTGFLAMMSHELHTPLNAIGGYTELLEMGVRGPVNDAQRDDLRRIRRAQRHLLGIINDILNFARLEHGIVEYDIGDVSVSAALETLRTVMEPQLPPGRITLHVALPSPDLFVRADPERVNQILLNLGQNALHFTEAGHITITSEARDGIVAINVADTGRGVPAKRLATIWEPFVQVARHLNETSQQGVGLGLATSLAMARAMGGELSAVSTPDIGSTFTLTLPHAAVTT